MQSKRIAIIGGGAAGTMAAWTLGKVHDVTLFEKEDYLGGHAYTHEFEIEGNLLEADLGVELFTEKHAPNLCELLKKFNVETYVAPLSFQATFPGKNNYWNNVNHDGELWKRVKDECNRFHMQMHEVMHLGSQSAKGQTIGQFLEAHQYSDEFIYGVLLPLSTTFSGCQARMLEYSLTYTALSFNLGLLSLFQPGYWRKARGGINAYLQALQKDLTAKIILQSKISTVARENNKVKIVHQNGENDIFDEVIFATHLDIALSLMGDASEEEREILSQYHYVPVKSVLHTDANILSEHYQPGIYCEYVGRTMTNQQTLDGYMTRVLNELEPNLCIKQPMLVTFDDSAEIDPQKVLKEQNWKLPRLKPADILNRLKLRNIQGKNQYWFCGTDTSVTGHEGALVSGLVIANALGADYPFADNPWAKIQFDLVKGLMGISTYKQKVLARISDFSAYLAKSMKLEEQLIARTLLKMYT